MAARRSSDDAQMMLRSCSAVCQMSNVSCQTVLRDVSETTVTWTSGDRHRPGEPYSRFIGVSHIPFESLNCFKRLSIVISLHSALTAHFKNSTLSTWLGDILKSAFCWKSCHEHNEPGFASVNLLGDYLFSLP